MEFSATREMKYCDWSIDDMRAADCKKLAEKPEGVFRQAKKTGSCEPVFSFYNSTVFVATFSQNALSCSTKRIVGLSCSNSSSICILEITSM